MENELNKKKILPCIVKTVVICIIIVFLLLALYTWVFKHRYILKGKKVIVNEFSTVEIFPSETQVDVEVKRVDYSTEE